MSDFVFSMDSHVVEPKALWAERLPEKLRPRALRTERLEDRYMAIIADGKVMHRLRLGDENAARIETRVRMGGGDPKLRIKDMTDDGISAEILYPNAGMMIYFIEDPELSRESIRTYNDWLIEAFGAYPGRFVPTAMLPVRDVGEALAEFERVLGLGYRSVMMPIDVKNDLKYNDPLYDPLWEMAAGEKVPISFHVATGLHPIRERGRGGAVINYTVLMTEAMDFVTYLVCSGAFERNPSLNVVIVEGGVSWLAPLCERMDECAERQQMYMDPKLSMLPSQYVRRNVHATFSHDRAAIFARRVTGVAPLLWASDYPHTEGTFPHSRRAIEAVFADTGVTAEERKAILGGTAAKLYGLDAIQ
ncbi:MAG: amidohydrolase family protein [Gammaproteobacteria bacterium]